MSCEWWMDNYIYNNDYSLPGIKTSKAVGIKNLRPHEWGIFGILAYWIGNKEEGTLPRDGGLILNDRNRSTTNTIGISRITGGVFLYGPRSRQSIWTRVSIGKGLYNNRRRLNGKTAIRQSEQQGYMNNQSSLWSKGPITTEARWNTPSSKTTRLLPL